MFHILISRDTNIASRLVYITCLHIKTIDLKMWVIYYDVSIWVLWCVDWKVSSLSFTCGHFGYQSNSKIAYIKKHENLFARLIVLNLFPICLKYDTELRPHWITVILNIHDALMIKQTLWSKSCNIVLFMLVDSQAFSSKKYKFF